MIFSTEEQIDEEDDDNGDRSQLDQVHVHNAALESGKFTFSGLFWCHILYKTNYLVLLLIYRIFSVEGSVEMNTEEECVASTHSACSVQRPSGVTM